MSKYVSWSDLREKTGYMPFELVERLLQDNGVQPFTQNGTPVPCPNKYNQTHIQKREDFDSVKAEVIRLNRLKARLTVVCGRVARFRSIAESAEQTADELEFCWRMYLSIMELKELEVLSPDPSHYDKGVCRFEHLYQDRDPPRYKLDPPLPPDLIIKESPGRKYFYVFNHSINELESLLKEITDRLPKACEGLKRLKIESIRLGHSEDWKGFVLATDDALREEFIELLNGFIFKIEDVEPILNRDGGPGQTPDSSPSPGGIPSGVEGKEDDASSDISKEAIEYGREVLLEVERLFNEMKDGIGSGDDATPKKQLECALECIDNDKASYPILSKKMGILKEEHFHRLTKRWRNEAKVLQAIAKSKNYNTPNYQTYYHTVKKED